MTDQELLQKYAGGNIAAGRTFVEMYQDKVYAVCYSFLRNAHDAEDVAQEVFIEAIRNADKFRGDARLGTWLYRIAVNRSLNFLRDNRKRRFWQELDALISSRGGEPEANHTPGDGILEQRDEARLIADAIANLPEKQRIAFMLNKIEDLSYAEVAEVMEASFSSVESLIFRARENLQKKLKKYFRG